jgi:hypothetical protein
MSTVATLDIFNLYVTIRGGDLEEDYCMPQMKTSHLYYTATEVKQVLGITHGMLYQYVRNGNLHPVIPPGKKQGVYSRKEVDKLALELQAFFMYREKLSTSFVRVVSREEMGKCLDISQELFGVGREILDECMGMIERNPYICYALKASDEVTIGYTGITPLKPGKLDGVLAQTLPVRVLPEDMEVFEAGKHLDIYIGVMAIRPGFTSAEKHTYGSRLIAGLAGTIIDLGRQGVIIDTIAARSSTADGIKLMRHIGFTEIERATPERRTFIINVKPSGIPFMEQYKHALAEWNREEEAKIERD